MMTVRTLVPTLDRVLSINRELDRVFTRTFGDSGAWLPAMDVVERSDTFVVTLDVPGVSHESIDLTFDRGALTIRGTRAGTEYGEQDKIYVAERTLGDFERVVRLPETVDADRIEASFDRGVVTILIPKAAAARARKIAISTNGHHA
jgi:HSP20 family protein